MENRNVIIILVVVVIVLAVVAGAMFLKSGHAKEPTKVKITSDKKQFEGGKLKLQLTGLNKTALSKQNVNIIVKDKKGKVVVNETIKTNSKGNAKLDLDLKKGKYSVIAFYKGNENHTGNNTTQKLTIKEKVKKTASVDSSSSSQSDRFAGANWQKRTHWDDGTPVEGDLYLITTADGDYWTYENGNYYHGADKFI